MFANQPTRRQSEARERDVWGLLRFVDDFGGTANRFFERLYRGLLRKQASVGRPPQSDPDQMTALRQANRELSARMKEAQTVASRLETVFKRIDEGVIMQSPEGRVVLINEAAMRLIGSMRAFWDSDLGRMFKKIHEATPAESAESAENAESEFEQIDAPVKVQINERILGATVAVAYTPERKPLGTLIVLRDITREALADRLKDQFVTQITHELRTPLTAIKGMSDVLLNQPTDRPPNRRFLETIGRNAAILDRMIIELLDISEMSAGTFAIRRNEVALDELITDIVRGRDPQIRKAGLTAGIMIANRSHLKVIGDAQRLHWAIGHLLDNAISYTPKGGYILIRVGRVKGARVLIEVIDNGVGITDYDQQHIFERFYRGEARTKDGKTIDPRGLGQGLYIARAVAEAHQGYLAVSSAVGEGSKFTLGLPFVKPADTK